MADEGWIDGLLRPAGEALLAEIGAAPPSPGDELRLITRLRERHPPELVRAALNQAKLRARARAKFPNADRMYFTAPGLEQASTEAMARHHAARFAGAERMVDLCSGIGGDLVALAEGRTVVAVDRDPVHIRLASLNAAAHGVGGSVRCVCADVRDVRLTGIDAVFVDPARRTADRRLPSGTSEPPLEWCFALAEGGRAVGIKASPALPLERVPDGWELEFVSEGGELKEAVLWSPRLRGAGRRATLLPGGDTLVAREGAEVPVRLPGRYLLDPDPAVTRAGAVEELARALGAWKVDPQIAFLSADRALLTPFGRTLAVEASAPWNLKSLRRVLRDADVGVVDIRKRGSGVDVDEIHRRLRLAGSRSATVVLTRVSGRPWMLVCTDPPPAGINR